MTAAIVENAESGSPGTMQCMEVWGGNDAVDRVLEFSGLDAWVYSRPSGKAAAGGDLHYLSSCATGRVARILVADVSGHGVSVAPIAELLRRLLRRYVNYIDQSGLVAELNRSFHGDESEEVASRSYATALVMSWFGPAREMGICTAGHPAPLHRRHGSSAWKPVLHEEPQEADGPLLRNVPLGVLAEARYDRIELRLDVGDLLLVFTDAVIETLGGGSARRGLDVLGAFLDARDPAEDPGDLIRELAAELERLGAQDDVTILILRPNGRRPWTALSRRIGGPLRVLGAVIRGLGGRFSEIPWPELSLANLGGALFESLNRRRKDRSPRS